MALTGDKKSQEVRGDFREPGVKSGARIYTGALVCLDGSGYAVPAKEATDLVPIGIATHGVDATGLSHGDERVRCRVGIFRLHNSADADLITVADIGAEVYAVDDETVAKTSGSDTRSVVGTVYDIADEGLFVRIH